MTVALTAAMTAALTADELCALEPIRVPGSIQDSGVLIAMPMGSSLITHVSSNVERFLGMAQDTVLGTPLQTVIGDALAKSFSERLGNAALSETAHYLGRIERAAAWFDVTAHRHDGMDFVELEPQSPNDPSLHFSWVYNHVQPFARGLDRVEDATALCALAVRHIFALTGFGRVMAYRFDRDGHGEVLSEACQAGYTSFAGHWFPASDIPAQARALYVQNRIRLIANALQPTVPIVSTTSATLDLSFAALRSVSPVHIQYLKNMGTHASMSISLVVEGRLWGMISCHNHEAHSLPFETRAAAAQIGHLASLQIGALLGAHEGRQRGAMRIVLNELASAVIAAGGNLNALVALDAHLLQFAGAQGCAIVAGTEIHLIGATPTEREVGELSDWLDRTEQDSFSTDHLAAAWPAASAYARLASGLLAIATSAMKRNYILWFRQEEVAALQWAGEPATKLPMHPDAGVPLSPRTSFRSWVQMRRGQAPAWSAAEIEVALELRSALLLEALRVAKHEADQANQAKNRFLAVLSHELRTPLSPIMIAAQVLESSVAIPPKFAGMLSMIRRNVQLEARLIDDLLDLTSIEHGKIQINRLEISVYTALNHAIDMLRDQFDTKKVELEVVRSATSDTALADGARIQQIVWNLVRNALKFTATGGHVVVHASNPAPLLFEVSVIDDGIGIDAEALEGIFKPFQQANAAITERFGGLGLGLAIARSLAELHGGAISVSSLGLGKGATFTLRLPLIVSANEANEPFANNLRAYAGSLSILMVEDSADTAGVMQLFLESLGHRVTAALDVRSAKAFVQAQPFDLLLCDLGLTDGHGNDVVRAVANRYPAIALSGYGTEADRSDSQHAGFAAHLTKPVELTLLAETVDAAVAAFVKPAVP